MRRACTATTIAPAHLAAGAVVAAALLVADACTGDPTWLAVVSAALALLPTTITTTATEEA